MQSFLCQPKWWFVKYKDCIEIHIHNKPICDYTIATNEPPSHVTKHSKTMIIYIYHGGGDKKKKVSFTSQLAFHTDKINFMLAIHKKINEWGRSISKTAAQYFSDESYVRLMYHLCTSKTTFLEDLSSKYKKKSGTKWY